MIPFGTKSVTLSMLIDLLTSTCRSTQVKITSTDLWPEEMNMFTFSEMLALVESESSFGAYVCHRRPGGFTATSDLVALSHLTSTINQHTQCALVGTRLGTPPGELSIIEFLPSSRFQLSHSHPRMRTRWRIHHLFSQICEDDQVLHFSKLSFYIFVVSFTIVIKWYLGGESAFGDRTASSKSKFSAAVSSDLGKCSF